MKQLYLPTDNSQNRKSALSNYLESKETELGSVLEGSSLPNIRSKIAKFDNF